MVALDLVVIVGWLGFSLYAGLRFRQRGSSSPDAFFVSDRSLPWWVVGTSMVATTFAADTPLAVSGYVAASGIAHNWRWWFSGVGALATVFFFARLWRRAEVITEAELTELRYGGPAARALRGVTALWFGVFMNLLVIAWVMRAMRKVVEVVLGLAPDATWLGMPTSIVVVLALFVMAVGYTGAAGLYGVVATDVIQFPVAMAGSILLAVLSWNAVGGLEGLHSGFAAHGFDWEATTTLIPIGDPASDGATAQFVVLMGVMWWASRNVDGGSYLAQRLFAARDENHALWGYLWFAVANICLRPWPWIVVGLCGMAMFGPQVDPETYYPRMMAAVVPAGLFGLLVASFLAAFMSTIDTQLHWGASMIINDIYRRFLRPKQSDAHMLAASRAAIIGLAVLGALASFVVQDIRAAWELAIAITAGIGTVHIARWYWWRVNAWSEFAALGVAGIGTLVMRSLRAAHPALNEGVGAAWISGVPAGWLAFPFDALGIVCVSIPVWVAVTFVTAPGERSHLRAFYAKVRPGGPGWRHIAGDMPGFEQDGPRASAWLGVLFGCAGLFGTLLCIGASITGQWEQAAIWGAVGGVGIAVCAKQVARETAASS